jgi:hypothetical protein
MVIEYVGELVRPAVADARERRCYDSLVGAGTYVFRLNAARCVDATRAGNLAHLLNHSCQPNCFSRTLPVLGAAAGAAEDHVVISALREVSEALLLLGSAGWVARGPGAAGAEEGGGGGVRVLRALGASSEKKKSQRLHGLVDPRAPPAPHAPPPLPPSPSRPGLCSWRPGRS